MGNYVNQLFLKTSLPDFHKKIRIIKYLNNKADNHHQYTPYGIVP